MSCPECGAPVDSHEFGQECTECDWESVSFPDPPEGGWSRTSDMDRL